MAGNHGVPGAGQLPKTSTNGRRKKMSCKKREARRIRSWTVQNEMRGVLGRVSAGAAGRILNSANSMETRV